MKHYLNIILTFILMLSFNAFASSSTGWSSHSKTLADVSLQTGVDIELLATVGALESSFNSHARARTSSAVGLFQFTSRTWKVTLERHGAQFGLTANAKRTDPVANTLMAAEYLRENAEILKSRLGRDATMAEVYLAHMLAPRRVVQLVKAPGHLSAARMFPAIAKANRNLFYTKDGRQRSVSAFLGLIQLKVDSKHFAYRDVANDAFDLHLAEVTAVEQERYAQMVNSNDCNKNELVRKYGNVMDIPVNELIAEESTIDFNSYAASMGNPTDGNAPLHVIGITIERREFV